MKFEIDLTGNNNIEQIVIANARYSVLLNSHHNPAFESQTRRALLFENQIEANIGVDFLVGYETSLHQDREIENRYAILLPAQLPSKIRIVGWNGRVEMVRAEVRFELTDKPDEDFGVLMIFYPKTNMVELRRESPDDNEAVIDEKNTKFRLWKNVYEEEYGCEQMSIDEEESGVVHLFRHPQTEKPLLKMSVENGKLWVTDFTHGATYEIDLSFFPKDEEFPDVIEMTREYFASGTISEEKILSLKSLGETFRLVQ